jgi:hypothetical protein
MYPGHPERRELKALCSRRTAERSATSSRRRRQTPKKVPVEQTDLHGELKQHTREYKLLVDTVRCIAQNAEGRPGHRASPSIWLNPPEAKRLLQNVFSAPGDIRVSNTAITVSLAPAANRPERAALETFFDAINRRRLCHPGDPFARPIRFRLQIP